MGRVDIGLDLSFRKSWLLSLGWVFLSGVWEKALRKGGSHKPQSQMNLSKFLILAVIQEPPDSPQHT